MQVYWFRIFGIRVSGDQLERSYGMDFETRVSGLGFRDQLERFYCVGFGMYGYTT